VAIRVWSLRRCNRHTPTTARAAGRGAARQVAFVTKREGALPDAGRGTVRILLLAQLSGLIADIRHAGAYGGVRLFPTHDGDAEVGAQSARRLDMNGPTSTPTGDMAQRPHTNCHEDGPWPLGCKGSGTCISNRGIGPTGRWLRSVRAPTRRPADTRIGASGETFPSLS
jgi:hypothetical protein